jgi:hypothetical protein
MAQHDAIMLNLKVGRRILLTFRNRKSRYDRIGIFFANKCLIKADIIDIFIINKTGSAQICIQSVIGLIYFKSKAVCLHKMKLWTTDCLLLVIFTDVLIH